MSVYDMCTSSTSVIIMVGIAVYTMYDYWDRLYFKRKGIPGPWPLPFIGTLLPALLSTMKGRGFAENQVERQKKYGKVYGINFRNNIYVISDPEMLQEIFIKKFSAFSNRPTQPLKNRPFDEAVTMARDEHWKLVRNTLTPAFTGNKMKQMTPVVNETCDQLMKSFESHRSEGKSIQCKDIFGAYSMDVVAAVFFGLKVDSLGNPNDPFVKHAKGAFDFSVTSPKVFAAFVIPGATYVMNYFNISIISSSVTDFFTDVVARTLELRRNDQITRCDILQLMADAHKLDSDEEDDASDDGVKRAKVELSTNAIMANAMSFLLAGYETTNAALCFISYLLATHPEYQERLSREVDEVAPTRDDVSYEVLSKLEYLDCFVKEALRMYPPAALADRSSGNTDVVIKDLHIPKNSQIIIPVYAVHHDPDLWEEPGVFNPERFNKENRKNILPATWLPFGDGPRNCLGMRLAMMEIKFAVVRLLQVYKLETCPETEIPPVLNKTSAFISPPNGVKLIAVPRKKTE